MSKPKVTVPLSGIREAVVESFRNTRRMVLVLNSGEVVLLVRGSSRAGYYPEANAINDFLLLHRQPQ